MRVTRTMWGLRLRHGLPGRFLCEDNFPYVFETRAQARAFVANHAAMDELVTVERVCFSWEPAL